MTVLSSGIRKKSRKKGIDYEFLFMQASDSQLDEITKLIESGVIKTVLDKVYHFNQTNEALEHVASCRSKGKVVVNVK